MPKTLFWIAVALATLVGSTAVAGVASGQPTTSPTGSYIIVLKDSASPTMNALRHGVAPTHVYRAALNGYSADLSDVQLQAITTDSSVRYVSPDETFTIAAKPSPSRSRSQRAQIVSRTARRIGLL